MTHPSILIWGAGAIGGTIGAFWARAGLPVTMVDLDKDHAKACATTGLQIKGPVEHLHQIIPTYTPDQIAGVFDVVVLAVKAQATETALQQLMPHLAADGYVLSAQNGLNEIMIAQIVGHERCMGCFVNFGADWQAPGEILFGNRGAVVVGEIDGTIRTRTQLMHGMLQIFDCDCVLTDNIWGYLWGKLAYGAMLFATALTADSMADNFRDPRRFVVFHRLGREVMAVARARGIKPIGFNGFDPACFMPGAEDAEARDSIARLAEFNSKTAKTHSGIYRDLAVRKRKTEVDAQIGIITALGRDVGIETPGLQQLVSLIHDLEEGHKSMSFDTFHTLISTCEAAGHASPL